MPANRTLKPTAKPSRKELGGPPPQEFKTQKEADSGNPMKGPPKGARAHAARNPFLSVQKRAMKANLEY